MEQKDYILREIEKISTLILALLGRLQRITGKNFFDQERGLIDEKLQESAGLTIDLIISTNTDELEALLTPRAGFTFDNIELLADLLVGFSEYMYPEESLESLNKAIYMLQWIDRESKTFSMARQLKIADIEDRIKNGSGQ